MLPPVNGCIHLSVSAGCGGTTFALQHARNALKEGYHVVWICNQIPDGVRFSQIFSDISPASVSKLHLSAVGENIEIGIQSAMDLMNALNNIALIVIDDWTTKSGRPSSNLRNQMHDLVNQCTIHGMPLLAISAAYENADGGGWKSRGSLDGCDVWYLHRSERDSMIRELHIGDDVSEYTLHEEGFTPRM